MKRFLYVIRHPQTRYNDLGIFQGLTNSSITSKGRHQASKIFLKLKDHTFTTIYSSPLKRCRFVAVMFGKKNHKRVKYDRRLREICYGKWEGKNKKTLFDDPLYNMKDKNRFRFIHPGSYKGHKGSSYEEMANSLIPFWSSLKELKGDVLVVGHTGVMIAAKRYFERASDKELNDYKPTNDTILRYEIV